MISTVSYFNTLNIKPIRVYPENSGRETTITSFEKVLSDKQDSISTKSVKKQEKTENDNQSTVIEETEDTGYKDPVTGKAVQYVDIAKKSSQRQKVQVPIPVQALILAAVIYKSPGRQLQNLLCLHLQ